MSTKRIPISRRSRLRITPQMIELFRRGLEIQKARLDDLWEEKGGRRSEFIDVSNALHRLLDLRPWHPHVLDAEPGPGPIVPLSPYSGRKVSRRTVSAIRRELEAALAAAERVPGHGDVNSV